MDKDKLAELLEEALDELNGESGIDRLTDAIEHLARAIEARPYWYYTNTWQQPPNPQYTITYSNGSAPPQSSAMHNHKE